MSWVHRAFASWPLTVKVPLLVAGLMIAVAIGISNTVLQRLSQTQEEHLAQLTGAYLDGLSTAVQPFVIRGDVWETFDVLDRARQRYAGVRAKYAIVALPDESVLAASDPLRFPTASRLPGDVIERLRQAQSVMLDEDGSSAWAYRALREGNAHVGSIITEIDISDLIALRHKTLMALIGLNGLLTVAFAAAGYFLVRRMLAPAGVLTAHLDHALDGPMKRIEDRDLPPADSEFGRLFRRFNQVADAVNERQALGARLAQKQKAAVIGKLASGLAHEVNNPLGGLFNAVAMIREHGEDPKIRRDATRLLERGLTGIRNLVRAALLTYKGPAQSQELTSTELDDLRFLIQTEVDRRQIQLVWSVALPDRLAVKGQVAQQAALNLLLNACAASPVGGTVEFAASADAHALSIVVRDQGTGLPEPFIALLRGGDPASAPTETGLGLWTVARLLRQSGGRAEVAASPAGTMIRLILPLERTLDAVA